MKNHTIIGITSISPRNAGADRVAILDLDGERGSARAAELGSGHIALACDVADEARVRDALAVVTEQAGSIDIFVNNAGSATRICRPWNGTSRISTGC
ncbi:MAG: hypothetical protein DI537_02420 [Stutzerimonas stutzeri]|nr:MAG: hypothetical protein DI537_02420 [Stutzerimonas stutzeri]